MAGYRSNSTVIPSSGTNTTLSKPTGTATGDMLVAVVHVEDNVLVTPPVGWSWLADNDHDTNSVDQWVFWRRASSAEPSSYTFTHASTWRGGYMVAVQNVSADVVPIVGPLNQGTSATWTALGLTTSGADAWVSIFVSSWDNLGLITPPTGFTDRWDIASNVYVTDQTKASAGATGDQSSGTNSGTEDWLALIVAMEDVGYTVAHPNVVQVTAETGTSLGSANAQPLPDDSASGDLVIYVVANDNTGATNMSGSTGWATGTLQGTSGMESQVFARVLDGTTGDNILSVTGAAEDYAAVGVRVPTGTHSVTSGNISTWMASYVTAATGASGNADPANLSPAGSDDYLWIAAAVIDCTASGDVITADPTGYSNLAYVKSAESTTSVGVRVAQKQATGASENPGAFTNTSRLWHAWTIAVPTGTIGGTGATATPATITATGSVEAPAFSSAATATTVTATAVGSVPASSVTAGTATVPDAIDDLDCAPGSEQVTLTWTAPPDGGATITDYIVEWRVA